MKSILLFIAILLLSCSKEKSQENMQLKAIADYSVSGKTITLKADKSTGDVKMYGWSLSPATSLKWNTSTYHVGEDFINMVVTVPSSGIYKANLIVYNHQNISQLPGGGESASNSIDIEVK